MTRIAYLGTGLLGSGFVEAACGRGDQVTVWNRTRAKADALTAFGAVVADSPADAVRGADRVHLVLRDDAVVEEVIAAMRPGLSSDTIVVDHTTTRPDLTAERLTRLQSEGVRYLHAPVFIGPAAARQAQGLILVSGPEAQFETVRPALEQQAASVHYWGERPDLSAVYKLVGNAILQNRGRNMSQGKFDPSFELVMARKDIRLMVETADGRPLAALPGIGERMDAVIAQGFGDRDFGVIARDALAELSGGH
jgi:3-hydroxyisobutyrate dehydrogenase-like beta-hydroxyacid dehydrogenase